MISFQKRLVLAVTTSVLAISSAAQAQQQGGAEYIVTNKPAQTDKCPEGRICPPFNSAVQPPRTNTPAIGVNPNSPVSGRVRVQGPNACVRIGGDSTGPGC